MGLGWSHLAPSAQADKPTLAALPVAPTRLPWAVMIREYAVAYAFTISSLTSDHSPISANGTAEVPRGEPMAAGGTGRGCMDQMRPPRLRGMTASIRLECSDKSYHKNPGVTSSSRVVSSGEARAWPARRGATARKTGWKTPAAEP
jgi:hypothetical protein